MFSIHTKNYIGRIAISYNPKSGKGYTLNLFIRFGCWAWGLQKETDGWGTFCFGPIFQFSWDNGKC